MRRWRDLLIVIGLFAILIAFTIYGPGRNEPEEQGRPGSTHSADTSGALGLQRWLESIGYQPRNLEYTAWQIPDGTDALLILGPLQAPLTDDEADETLRWVRDGGTLILIEPFPSLISRPNRLIEALNAAIVDGDVEEPVERAEAVQPLLTTPPVTSVRVDVETSIDLDRDDYLPLLRTRLGETLVGVQEGSGYVYVGTSLRPFTNEGIREAGSAPLILNLLSRVPAGGTIVFDEFHHGYQNPPTLRRIALQQGWGWAAAYAVLVVGLYILLTGRRFGRPVPLRADVARRSSAEYIQSMAMLLQRGGKQEYVRAHYHDQLKRRLARPYGFAPPTDDEAFIRELQRYRGITDEQAQRLAPLLAQLRTAASQEQLVRLVRAADAFADEKGRIR